MYADAQQSCTPLAIDESAAPSELRAERLPFPIAACIMVGTSAALWLGIVKVVSLIG